MGNVKSPLASLTVWFNALTILGAFLAFAVNDPTIGALLKEHPDALKWIISVQAIVNLALRFKTKEPIVNKRAA